LISALSSTGLIIERVVVEVLVLGTNFHGRLEHLPKKAGAAVPDERNFESG
jgi:hypothetical protein